MKKKIKKNMEKMIKKSGKKMAKAIIEHKTTKNPPWRPTKYGPELIKKAWLYLDLKMPKVNGLEVLRRIRADERTKRIPVVMLTSSKEDPDIQKCYDLGVNSYVVKPLEFDEFQKAISNLGLYWMIVNQPPA